MDWTRLEVPGRVTAVQRGLCAGVTAEGTVFTAQLRLPHLRPTTYDDLLVDSFGVLGVAPGDETWLTGRGADGRLHLWASGDGGDADVGAHSLDAVDAMWAAPTQDAGTALLLTATWPTASGVCGPTTARPRSPAATRRSATSRSPARPTAHSSSGVRRRSRWSWRAGSVSRARPRRGRWVRVTGDGCISRPPRRR